MGDKHLFVCAHVCKCYLLTTFLPHLPFCFALILETLSHHRFMDPDRTFFQAGWSFRWSFWWHLLQWFSTHFVPKPHQRESQMAFRRTFSNLRFTGIEIACISLIRHFHIKLPQHSFRVLLSRDVWVPSASSVCLLPWYHQLLSADDTLGLRAFDFQ